MGCRRNLLFWTNSSLWIAFVAPNALIGKTFPSRYLVKSEPKPPSVPRSRSRAYRTLLYIRTRIPLVIPSENVIFRSGCEWQPSNGQFFTEVDANIYRSRCEQFQILQKSLRTLLATGGPSGD